MKKISILIIAFLQSVCFVNGQEFLSVVPTTASLYDAVQADMYIRPKSGEASDSQPSEGIELSFDGDMNTMYHSRWQGATVFPITLDYKFDNSVSQIDYAVYYPRTSGSNGHFIGVEVWYKADGGEMVKYKDYDFGGSSSPSTVTFEPAIRNPEIIRFVVKTGTGDSDGGYAACAEMEFYRKNSNFDYTTVFADATCSELKPEVTIEDINAIGVEFYKKLASDLFYGLYDAARWTQEYKPYRPINSLVSELKTSTYNAYENPTGVLAEPGSTLIIFVSGINGGNIYLESRDWDTDRTRTYPLREGINRITPSLTGNTYINYYTVNYKTAEPVKIHIYGGRGNGVFFRSKHSNDDWKSFLSNAVGNYLDIVGTYSNMAFYIPALKNSCPEDGVKLVEMYDEIVEMQFEQMGLFKYNRVPTNHMFSRNTLTGYMSAGGIGANFQYATMNDIGNPSRIPLGDNCWGIAHELGHVNQVRPGLRWIGTVEVTNNVYSSYAQYMITSKYADLHLRLEHESCAPIAGESNVLGGRFNSHLHYGVLKGQKWLFQWGQDGQSDHFVKLVPLWQLNLYFKLADQLKKEKTGTGVDWGKPDWYGDICELVRQDNNPYSHGEHQINFIKRACEVTETNLIAFFEKAGLLKEYDDVIEDYSKEPLQITRKMCDDVKSYIEGKNWPEPEGLINYISGNTVGIYADKLPVEGTLNAGFTNVAGGFTTVSHNVWKNAVVYETYAGEELIRITMAGTGTKDNSSTRVPFPTNATRIEAVAWDGTRTTAYQK